MRLNLSLFWCRRVRASAIGAAAVHSRHVHRSGHKLVIFVVENCEEHSVVFVAHRSSASVPHAHINKRQPALCCLSIARMQAVREWTMQGSHGCIDHYRLDCCGQTRPRLGSTLPQVLCPQQRNPGQMAVQG